MRRNHNQLISKIHNISSWKQLFTYYYYKNYLSLLFNGISISILQRQKEKLINLFEFKLKKYIHIYQQNQHQLCVTIINVNQEFSVGY